jgi:putative transposase
MDEYETLNHTTWDSKYHVVFIPKYRRKLLFQELRKPLSFLGNRALELPTRE